MREVVRGRGFGKCVASGHSSMTRRRAIQAAPAHPGMPGRARSPRAGLGAPAGCPARRRRRERAACKRPSSVGALQRDRGAAGCSRCAPCLRHTAREGRACCLALAVTLGSETLWTHLALSGKETNMAGRSWARQPAAPRRRRSERRARPCAAGASATAACRRPLSPLLRVEVHQRQHAHGAAALAVLAALRGRRMAHGATAL